MDDAHEVQSRSESVQHAVREIYRVETRHVGRQQERHAAHDDADDDDEAIADPLDEWVGDD